MINSAAYILLRSICITRDKSSYPAENIIIIIIVYYYAYFSWKLFLGIYNYECNLISCKMHNNYSDFNLFQV